MTATLARRRVAATAAAVAFLFAIGGFALLARGGDSAGTPGASDAGSLAFGSSFGPTASPFQIAVTTPTGSPMLIGTAIPSASASPSGTDTASPAGSGFQPIDMFATPPPRQPDPSSGPSSSGPSSKSSLTPPRPTFHSTDAPFHPSENRPTPDQPLDWMTAKAAGRVALVDGRVTMLGPTVDPLLMPATGGPIPAAHTLDLSWTRWIVEPPGRGIDEKGTAYVDRSYWNFCGPGATTVTLYYWQQLTGRPNVTGTRGHFLDPYAAEGVPWPSSGPLVAVSGGQRLGTYWSGSDSVSGFTAHGRGFVMYMATRSQPPTWNATGITVWADSSGHAYYPTRGASLNGIQAGLNWEASGHDTTDWVDAWYGTVNSYDPTLARDLQAAVMLDVGRDGVPVVAAIDTYDLPNWRDGASTPHTRHAVSIVGYDNTASPPTYTYIDTCGRACNPRGGNKNGQIHVIAQSAMVAAIQDPVGIGFTW